VADTGIGIPYEAEDSIFERFKEIAETKEILYRGIGLRLAISKSLVELWVY
jgi:signal transduction histidine kinase